MPDPVEKKCFGAPVPSGSLQGCTEMPKKGREVTITAERTAEKNAEPAAPSNQKNQKTCKDVYFTEGGLLGNKVHTKFTVCSTLREVAKQETRKVEEKKVDEKQRSLNEMKSKEAPTQTRWSSIM